MGTRVLKAHIDAIVEALPAAKVALQINKEVRSFAAVLAQAVLTAGDGKTEYVITARLPSRRPIVFGPYVTRTAAAKAASKPLPINVIEPVLVVPLYKHPSKGIDFNE